MGAANNGGSAFPIHGGHEGDDPRNQIIGGGLSVRDYFAAKALAAMIGNTNKEGANCGAGGVQTFATYAYEFADAMLAERAQ